MGYVHEIKPSKADHKFARQKRSKKKDGSTSQKLVVSTKSKNFYKEHQYQMAHRGYHGTARNQQAKNYGHKISRSRVMSADFHLPDGRAGGLIHSVHIDIGPMCDTLHPAPIASLVPIASGPQQRRPERQQMVHMIWTIALTAMASAVSSVHGIQRPHCP